MRHALAMIAMFALLTPTHADEFHLTDAAGKVYGPFEFKQGETMTIAGQEYTIAKVLTKEQKIVEKMKSIIIPEIEFRQAHVRDVIDFSQRASVDFDTASELRHRGVSFVLNLGPPAAAPSPATGDPFAADPFANVAKVRSQTSRVPLITFSARHISLHETVNIVCKICDLQWSIQDSVIMIEPNKKEKLHKPSHHTAWSRADAAASGW